MTYSTGSKERDTLLRRAIGEIVALNEPLTFEAIAANLPNDFELETEEAEGMAEDMGHLETEAPKVTPPVEEIPAPGTMKPFVTLSPHGAPLPKLYEKVSLIQTSEDEPPPIPTVEEPSQPDLTMQQATDAVNAAHNALGEARIAYRQSQQHTRDMRAALATAITVWQTGQPPYTREMMTRDFIRGSNEARAQRAAKGVPAQVKQVGKSVIDRSAAYGTDNSPEGFARSHMKYGGAHRGAFPKSMHGRINYDPRLGPVAKVPGQDTQ